MTVQNVHDDHDDVATQEAAHRMEPPVDDCGWCWGYYDGFMAGPDGLDPAGNRHNFNPVRLGTRDYRQGAEAGLFDREALAGQASA